MPWKVVSKSVTQMSGEQCVMIPLALMMLQWPVDSWDFLVHYTFYFKHNSIPSIFNRWHRNIRWLHQWSWSDLVR